MELVPLDFVAGSVAADCCAPSLVVQMKMNKGDVLIEVATRIDTHTIWKEVRLVVTV